MRPGDRIPYAFHAYRKVVMEALCSTRLSGSDFRVVLFILAQTDGFIRDEDKLSPGFFSEKIHMVPSNLRRTIGRLRDWGVVSKDGLYYRVNPPDRWNPDVFLEDAPPPTERINSDAPPPTERINSDAPPPTERINSDAPPPTERINSDAPPQPPPGSHSASNLIRSAHQFRCGQRIKSDTVLKLPKENSIKKTTIENLPASSQKKLDKHKAKQQESVSFVVWLGEYEAIQIPNRAKLINLIRRALVATDAGTAEVQEWYQWVKLHDQFWRNKEPPVIAAQVLDKFPTWLKQRKEGHLGERREPTGEHGGLPGEEKSSGWNVIESGPDDDTS